MRKFLFAVFFVLVMVALGVQLASFGYNSELAASGPVEPFIFTNARGSYMLDVCGEKLDMPAALAQDADAICKRMDLSCGGEVNKLVFDLISFASSEKQLLTKWFSGFKLEL